MWFLILLTTSFFHNLNCECFVTSITHYVPSTISYNCFDLKIEVHILEPKYYENDHGTIYIKNEIMNKTQFDPLKLINEIFCLKGYKLTISTDLETKKLLSEILLSIGLKQNKTDAVFAQKIFNLKISPEVKVLQIWNIEFQMDSNLEEMFPKLKTLIIKSKFMKLAPSLVGLKNLETIQLDSSYLEILPESYFVENKLLKNIEIMNSNFKTFSPTIVDGLELNNLDLAINEAPFPIFGRHSILRTIRLYGSDKIFNEISPRQLFPGMRNLTEIFVRKFNLPKITKETFAKNLLVKLLDLSSNKIEEIDEYSFVHLTELGILNLEDNNIAKLWDGFLPTKIKKFLASKNRITDFQFTTFLPFLSDMDLRDNNLTGTFVVENIAVRYPRLNYLNLGGNGLESVVISGLVNVGTNFVLKDNKIKTLNILGMEIFDSQKGVLLNLNNNSMMCDCALKPFLEELQRENCKVRLRDDVECKNLAGETLEKFNVDSLKC